MKKLMAFIIVALFPFFVFASEYSDQYTRIKLEANDDFIVLTRDNLKNNSNLTKLGITEEGMLDILVKSGIYFDIVNSTNYDVAISDCIYNEDDDYIGYDLTYENGEKIGMGDVIKKHDTIRVKYKVLYKNYINVESYVIDTSFSILYEQVI